MVKQPLWDVGEYRAWGLDKTRVSPYNGATLHASELLEGILEEMIGHLESKMEENSVIDRWERRAIFSRWKKLSWKAMWW